MNKSVLISIQPKWCELIASGKKTIEVRKKAPKCDTPFKCYIYCTGGVGKEIVKDMAYRWKGTRLIKRRVDKGWLKDNPEQTWQILLDYGFTHQIHRGDYELNGKVIGEFVCDSIDEIHEWQLSPQGKFQEAEQADLDLFLECSCLSYEEVCAYRKNLPYYQPLYGWHISDLKIYDKPKELGEFFTVCNKTDNDECGDCLYLRIARSSYPCDDDIDTWCGVDNKKPLSRPPQSWCYVEEL